jgi:hypothetical protein
VSVDWVVSIVWGWEGVSAEDTSPVGGGGGSEDMLASSYHRVGL